MTSAFEHCSASATARATSVALPGHDLLRASDLPRALAVNALEKADCGPLSVASADVSQSDSNNVRHDAL